MLQNEIYFCDAFAGKEQRPYGILYFNEKNPHSHDSNHANILDVARPLDPVLSDIKAFYTSRNLTPRIYASYVAGEIETLRPFLTAHGFKIQEHSSIFMLYRDKSSPQGDTGQSIKRITRITAGIVDLIHSEDDGDWTINVLKQLIHHRRFHLLGYFHQGHCVAIASVEFRDGYSRVDNVLTHKEFRGRHFGTRLINHLVHYHDQRLAGNYLYLYADNPIAIKLYENVGFRKVDIGRTCWSAHCP